MTFKFCPMCGGSLENRTIDDHPRLVCKACGFILYRNPTPAVGVVLIQDDSVLLVKRKYAPKVGDWSLPAGFMEYSESPEETAIRETLEETNLKISLSNLLGVFGAFDDPRAHVVLIIYQGEILGGDLCAGDDALEAKFFAFSELPNNIAFSTHRRVLDKFVQQEVND